MNNKTKYSLFTYLFLVATLFLFLFTKDFYTQMVENKEQIALLETKIKQKTQEYNKISKIKSQIDAGEMKDIQFNKFLIQFHEDELIDYFYAYGNQHLTNLKIESLHLSEWTLNEFGFHEAKINLAVTFNSEQDMINMINFLLMSDKYNLYIHEFNYHLGQDPKLPIQITLPLKVLYK